jgi:hypothetical protein
MAFKSAEAALAMAENFTTQRLLTLRKLTRAMADLLRNQAKEYLTALGPLFRPRSILGGYTESNPRETIPGAEKAFKDLQALHEAVAGSKVFGLAKELNPPLDLSSSTVEITPLEYSHSVQSEGGVGKIIAITAPLRWVLSYTGFPPRRFKEVLADRNRNPIQVQEFLLHYLVLDIVIARQPGLHKVFEALHFPLSIGKLPEFGDLPVNFLSCPVSTLRPPDPVVIESTDLSGTDAFEEVVSLEDVAKIRNPYKDQLEELVNAHGRELHGT